MPIDPTVSALMHRVFDDRFYLESNGDISDAGLDGFRHYVEHGRHELRRPSVLFDPDWYLDQNPDVAEAGLEPLEHFLLFGGFEGRNPIREGFDSAWYLATHAATIGPDTNPLVHFITVGADLGLDPSPYFDLDLYVKQYADVAESGLNPLVHFLVNGRDEGRRPNRRTMSLSGEDNSEALPVAQLLLHRQSDLSPLRTTPVGSVRRLNIVTDSIGADSLFGGVATALILGVLWAERENLRLRIVTRQNAADAAGLGVLFRTLGIRPAEHPELAFISTGPGDFLEVGAGDIFLTTSWWTTASVLESIPANRVAYILQEDERAFYPVGPNSLGAQSIMNRPDLTVVVNTRGLMESLAVSGVENLRSTATSFEPSFSTFLRPGRQLRRGEVREFFFYARPNNPRNLFDLGIAAIDEAVKDGVLPKAEWRINLVGRALPALTFTDGSRPVIHETLGWDEYHKLIGIMDLGLSLMASPHPSYPPLDLAASGAVVVTNTWPGKASFKDVSERIVEVEPTLEGLRTGIREAARLVDQLAETPFAPGTTEHFGDWRTNLEPAVTRLAKVFSNV